MGYAYTPGLSVAEHAVVRKIRRLPLKGTILVKLGQRVRAEDVVAEAYLPGRPEMINVAGQLGIGADEILGVMLKQKGEAVAKDEAFARTKGLFGMFKSEVNSPIAGVVEEVSGVTGQVIIRPPPSPLQKLAYADGVVVETDDGESVTVEVRGTYIQGIFGVGGEVTGVIDIIGDSPSDPLDPGRIESRHRGHILVGGGLVTAAAVRRAVSVGAAAIVAGGLNDADLRDFLGFELGVAITGDEALGLTIVITEGFGEIAMAQATFDLLKKSQGKRASVNGATQIRAGVIRPELVVPAEDFTGGLGRQEREEDNVLHVGTRLRAIREPYFGRIGKCVAMPVELTQLSSETKVRVLEVEFDDGRRATLPRANVELIKES